MKIFKITFVLLTTVLLFNSAFAQDRDYHVYIDNDNNPSSGCTVNWPNLGSSISGADLRLTVTTDSNLPPNILSTESHVCQGNAFSAGTATGNSALGLNTGVNGADVFELAIDQSQLGINSSGSVLFYFATDSATAVDVVLTNDNNGPIFLGFAFPVPALGLISLLLFIALLLVISRKHLSTRLKLTAGMLFIVSTAWAMNIIVDGQTNDWSGSSPVATDPIGDTDGTGSFADFTAIFLTKSDDQIFIRMDMADLENQAPTANASNANTDEDQSVTITLTGSDPEGAALTFVTQSQPTNGSLGGYSVVNPTTSTVQYTPDTDFAGTDTFTVAADDGQVNSAPATVTVVVNPINDAPSFTSGGTVNVLKTAGPYSDIWATNITAGPVDEAGQTLTFNITANDNPTIFSQAPALDSNGLLIFVGVNNATGTANITVELSDDGGTANGGVDTSASVTFAITLQGVNDAPSFTVGANQALLEDAGAQTIAGWATAISAGPADEVGQTLTFNITANDNATLFSAGPAVAADGTLTYTTAADANGTANITLELMDDGGTANGGDDTSPPQNFSITVTAVNDVPSFTAGANENVLENATAQTVTGWATAISAGPADESGQTTSFTVTNDNNALFSSQPTIDPAGNLTYTPSAGTLGSAQVDVVISDDGGVANGGVDTSAIQTFTISVTDVNDAPSFTAGPNQTINEDAAAVTVAWATAISPGPANEAGQNVTFNITANDNTALFSAGPAVAPDGTLSYTTAADANGTANITLELMDDGGTANGGEDTSPPQNFSITVNPVNDAPSFTAGANESVLEESGSQTVNGWATAISPGPADEASQTVSFTVTNNNNALFSVQPSVDASGNLTYTPAANISGLANVSVVAMDNGGVANGGIDTSAAQVFSITVVDVNDAPSFTAGTNPPDSNSNTGAQSEPWASAISAGPASESGQTVNFILTETSIDADLSFSAGPSVNSTTGNIEYTAAGNAFGSATYDVVLMDDGGTANGGIDTSSPAESFTITVIPVNSPPTVTPPGPFDVNTNIRIAVPDGNSDLLSGATDVEPGTTLTIQGTGTITTTEGGTVNVNVSTGAFSYDPPAGFTGADSFDYVVCDDGFPLPSECSASATVNLTVAGNTIWFIDNTAAAGDGTLQSPFNSLSAFNGSADPGDGDYVYLATGSGTYNESGIDLANNQTLFGQGKTGTFDAVTGITAATFSIARPTLGGTRPQIVSSANGILLANSNTISGLNVGNTSNYGFNGSAVGNLSVNEVNVTGSGGAINIATSGTFGSNVNFGILETDTGATHSINLNNVTGTLGVSSSGTGLINNAPSSALRISGGNLNFTYPGTISDVVNRPINISSMTGGTIDIGGLVVGRGVLLSNNTGVTFNFSSIDLDTTGIDAFSASGGGTINVSGSNNTIDTATGMAVFLQNINLGSSGFTLNQVNVNGATSGIVLDTVSGPGQFRVTGTGTTNGSGGTIQNNSTSGVTVMSSSNVELRNMNFTNSTNESTGCTAGVNGVTGTCHAAIELIAASNINIVNTVIDGNGDASDELGIFANQVTNFDMDGVTVQNVSDDPDEHGIYVVNLSGTGANASRWQDLTVDNTVGDTAILITQSTGNAELIIDGDSTISNALDGGFEARTTNAAANLTVTIGNTSAVGVGDTVLIENTGTGASFFADNGTITSNVRNTVFQPGAGIASITRAGSGTNGVMFVGMSAQTSGASSLSTLNATANDITQDDGGAGGTGRSGMALGGSRNINGTIEDNIVESNDEYVRGFFTNFTGVGNLATNTITIDNNDMNMSGSGGNETIVGIEYNASDSAGQLSVTATNNTIFSAGDNGFSGGIFALVGDNGAGPHSNIICTDIIGNNATAPNAIAVDGEDYGLVSFTGTVLQLENPITGALSEAQVDNHIINNDAGAAATLATDVNVFNVGGAINGVNSSCPQ